MRSMFPRSSILGSRLCSGLLSVATLPYYRYYQFNTLSPIKRIARHASQPQDSKTLCLLLTKWRARKLEELKFISIACAILAAAVIGAFSWTIIVASYWLAESLWYCSLVLAILGILLSAQQISVLEILGAIPSHGDTGSDSVVKLYLQLLLFKRQGSLPTLEGGHSKISSDNTIWAPRWKMIFTWQCPIMFMSYSVTLFLGGLTLVVCTPLINGDPWSGASNTAVIYLSICATGGALFVACSYWVYHYVDLEAVDTQLEGFDIIGEKDQEPVSEMLVIEDGNIQAQTPRIETKP